MSRSIGGNIMDIKVAAFPDETKVISNVGKRKIPDLKVGDKVEVYEPQIKIKDPDTDETIDCYGSTKEKLVITNLYDNYFVARKKKVTTDSPFNFNAITPLLGTVTTSYEPIKIDQTDTLVPSPESEYIKIGDHMRIYYDD